MSAPTRARVEPARGAGGWVELARRAGRGEARGTGEQAQRMLVIVLAGARHAIPVERVREIVRLRPVTPVPRMPSEVRGVISLRGQVIQVIDLRRRLALPTAEAGRSARIVVAHDGDGQVAGLLVDAVAEVASVRDEDFCDAPSGPQGSVGGLCRIGGAFVSLVDLDRVMSFDAGE
jgi:purine-binding chemotaxis protein CheW